jgi:hypothetical protein
MVSLHGHVNPSQRWGLVEKETVHLLVGRKQRKGEFRKRPEKDLTPNDPPQ